MVKNILLVGSLIVLSFTACKSNKGGKISGSDSDSVKIANHVSIPAQQAKISKVKINFVDFDIETDYSIKCNEFKKVFGSGIKTQTISDVKTLDSFDHFINKMIADTTNYIPDIRAKLEIYYNDGATKTLCMNNIGAQLNGRSMLLENDFVTFIETLESRK